MLIGLVIAALSLWPGPLGGQATAPIAWDPALVPPPATPMTGTNMTHSSFDGCSLSGSGILAEYDHGSTRADVQRQLAEMRLSGVESLRMIVWHMTDASRQDWGVVSSEGGHLTHRVRRNLADYLSDVKRFRFRRITIAFGPQYTNSPTQQSYVPATIEENWGVISEVRSIAEASGAPDVRFDLLNEGAPSDAQPARTRQQIEEYITTMYVRYAREYGTDDLVVSSIGSSDDSDRGRRLAALIRILRSTGDPLPRWFDVHMNYSGDGVLHALREAHDTLTAAGLDQPLVVGETAYDSEGAAQAVATFRREAGRSVDEVLQWYEVPGSNCPIEPPYRVDAFRATR